MMHIHLYEHMNTDIFVIAWSWDIFCIQPTGIGWMHCNIFFFSFCIIQGIIEDHSVTVHSTFSLKNLNYVRILSIETNLQALGLLA